MSKSNETRVALVTGGTRGLGRALTMALANEGLRVFTTGRDAGLLAELEAVAAADGLAIVALRVDHTVAADNERVEQRIAEAGGLDVLIFTAGILGPRVSIEDYPVADWERVLAVNLTAPFVLTKLLMPHLRPDASVQLLSSGVGVAGRAEWGAYSVSKFGIESLGQTLAGELRDREIRVNVIDPGSMRTAMRAAAYPAEDPLTLVEPSGNTACFVWLALEAGIEVTGRRFESQHWSRE